jgi:hypothetical protein
MWTTVDRGPEYRYGQAVYDTAIVLYRCSDQRYALELIETILDESGEMPDDEDVAL